MEKPSPKLLLWLLAQNSTKHTGEHTMKKTYIYLAALLPIVLVSAAFAAFEGRPSDAACVGFGDIPQVLGVSGASLFGSNGISAGGGWSRSFDHPDFDALSAWISWGDAKIGRIGLTSTNFSTGDLTTETKLRLGYSRAILADAQNTLSLAAAADVYSLSYGNSVRGTELGSATSMSLTLALDAKVFDRTRIAIAAENITAADMGTEAEVELPRTVSAVLAYEPYKYTQVAFAAVRRAGQDFSYSVAAEGSPVEFLTFRSGFATSPNRFSAGLGLKYKFANVEYAIITHPVLPLSHYVSVGVNFVK